MHPGDTTLTPDAVIEAAAQVFDVTVDEIANLQPAGTPRRRGRPVGAAGFVGNARQLAMYLLFEHELAHYEDIGAMFNVHWTAAYRHRQVVRQKITDGDPVKARKAAEVLQLAREITARQSATASD